MHIFINFNGDESEPMTGPPSFKAFSAEGPSRCVTPPEVVRKGVTVLEAYGFERARAVAIDGRP
jgi:hypothetical protein